MSDHLLRVHAPISDANWAEIDDEARERMAPGLAARRLVDVSTPHGWEYSATNLGRVEKITFDGMAERLQGRRRVVQPVAELRADFTISRAELRAGDRGAADVDFDDLDLAAQQVVAAENVAVFHGWQEAGIHGITSASSHPTIPRGEDVTAYPTLVAQAVEHLLRAGVGGPYGLALCREEWTAVVENAEHGAVLLFDHLAKILDGPVVWAPGIQGAVVLSLRGGDFLFETGQDLSIGYSAHDAETVDLFLEESFSFRVATPEAAVAIG
jgi:uncharacterized linocin/CFP29 family protein